MADALQAGTGEPPCECDPATCYSDCCQRHVCRWQREQIAYWLPLATNTKPGRPAFGLPPIAGSEDGSA